MAATTGACCDAGRSRAGHRHCAVLDRHAVSRPGEPARRRLRLPRAGSRGLARDRRPRAVPDPALQPRLGREPDHARCWRTARAAMMIEVSPAEAGPGALVLFRMMPRAIAKHVGILTGPDSFLHAYERLGVIEEPLTQCWAAAHRLRLPVPATLETPDMATLVLGAAGAAIGGSIGGAILGVSAATIGGFIGSSIGSVVDSWIISSLAPTQRIEGARLDTLRKSPLPTEGAVIPRLYGRMRMGRQTSSGRRISARRRRPPRRAAARAVGAARSRRPSISTTHPLRSRSARGRLPGSAASGPTASCSIPPGSPGGWYPGDASQTADPFIAAKMGAAGTPRLSRHCLRGLRGPAARKLRQPPAAAQFRGVPPARRSRHRRRADPRRHQ